MIYECDGPGKAVGGADTIKVDEEYYFSQIYDGFENEKVVEQGELITNQGFRIKFKVLNDPAYLRHTLCRIEKIESIKEEKR